MLHLKYQFTLLLFIINFATIQAQFYQDADGDGLGSAWHPDTSSIGVTNNLDADDGIAAIGLSFAIPPIIYGTVGDTTVIRYRNLLFVENANIDSLNFHIQCTDPSSLNGIEKWTCAPATAGTYALIMTITKGNDTLGIDSSNLIVSQDSFLGTNTRNIIMLGHSFIEGGWQLLHLNQALSNGNNPNYALKGTKNIWVDPNIHHDGYSGMGWNFFSGSASPITDGMPFGFDIQAYFDSCNNGFEPEYIIVELDINDFFFNSSLNQNFISVAHIDTVILSHWNQHATPVIDALTSFGCAKVAVTIPTPPSTDPIQSGGFNLKIMQLIQKRVAALGEAYWGDREDEDIYYIPINSAINTDTEFGDMVHPSNVVGYNIVANQVFSWLKHEFQTEHYCADRTVTWLGGSGNWNQTSNWDCNCIPTVYDHVFIKDVGSEVTIQNSYIAFADSITLDKSAKLIMDTSSLLNFGNHGIYISDDSETNILGTLAMNGGSVLNDGLFSIQNGTISGTGCLHNSVIGTIKGTGSISLETQDKGILEPSANLGTLIFSDSLDKPLGNSRALLSDISNYSKLKIGSTTSLTNPLEVQLLNGFMPQLFDSFDILQYPAGYSGSFQPITLPDISPNFWEVEYLPTKLRLKVNANLPITLISFSGKSTADAIQLNWKTASEFNTERFELQRKTDSKWTKLSTTNATGFSKQNMNYQSFDTNPSSGSNFYRLKIIDFNKVHTFSPIIEIKHHTNEFDWWLSKDTIEQSIRLHWESENNTVDIAVFSTNGTLIFEQKEVRMESGKSTEFSLPLKTVNFVRIRTKQGYSSSKKI